MSNSKAVQEALENARIVALARQESVPDMRPPGESLYNVAVRAVEHDLVLNPDFRPSDLPDDFYETGDPHEAAELYAALPEGQRVFRRTTEESFHERIVFAPDAEEACERALDVVMWDAGASANEWWVEAVVPV